VDGVAVELGQHVRAERLDRDREIARSGQLMVSTCKEPLLNHQGNPYAFTMTGQR
jgi:hypothetical protein